MITLIVTDYKTMEQTVRYICDFQQKSNQSVHVVIVDNSDDDMINWEAFSPTQQESRREVSVEGIHNRVFSVKECNEEWVIVQGGQNLGYARGNNLGARVADSLYNDNYYLFSNNDLLIRTERLSLEMLTEPMEQQETVAAVGPKIVGLDGEPQSPRKKISIMKMLFAPYFDMLLPPGWKITGKITDLDYTGCSKKCYWVSGAFICVDSKKFWQVGGFDEHTFLYAEEKILSERFAEAGYDFFFTDELELLHNHGQTVKSTIGVLKGITCSFESSAYYAKEYLGASGVVLFWAKIHFKIFSLLFRIKKKIAGKRDAKLSA